MNTPRPKSPQEYAQELERVLAQCLQPLKNIPFKAAIRAVAGCAVLDFDADNAEHKVLAKKIETAAAMAGKEAFTQGIFTARPNEAGNEIEPFVKAALLSQGLKAQTPVTANGKAKASGYPDIEIIGDIPCYLECKTYNLKNVETTQRAFYFSPSEVRFPPSMKNRLSAIATRTGVKEAALIRMATEEFLVHVETTKSITVNVCDVLRETPPAYGKKKKRTP